MNLEHFSKKAVNISDKIYGGNRIFCNNMF